MVLKFMSCCQITGLLAQAIIGFLMSGLYTRIVQHIAAFAVSRGLYDEANRFMFVSITGRVWYLLEFWGIR